MITIKKILKYKFSLSEDEYEMFTEWAIDDNKHKLPSEIPEIWNQRHGDLFKLDISGEIFKDLERMVDAWIDQRLK